MGLDAVAVKVHNLAQCCESAIVHIGCSDAHISKRHGFEFPVVLSRTCQLTDTSITISFGLAPGASGGGGIGGFQIVSLPDPPTTVKPEVKEVSFDSVSSLLSLTWSSDPGQTYAVKASTDLSNWGLEVATSIDAREDSDTTTEEIDLSGVPELRDQKKIYFRVERL